MVARTACRPAPLLPPLARRRRVDRLDADPARHQGAAGGAGGLSRATVPLLARREGVERAAPVPARRAGDRQPAEPGRRQVRHPRRSTSASSATARGRRSQRRPGKPLRRAAARASQSVSDSRAIEALYTLKVQSPAPAPGTSARSLFVDVFRLGDYSVLDINLFCRPTSPCPSTRTPIRRYTSGARCSTDTSATSSCATWRSLLNSRDGRSPARSREARLRTRCAPLLAAADQPDPDLVREPGLVPKAGALVTHRPAGPESHDPRSFTSIGTLGQNFGAAAQHRPAAVPRRRTGHRPRLRPDLVLLLPGHQALLLRGERALLLDRAACGRRSRLPTRQRALRGPLPLPPLLPPVHAALLAPARRRRLSAALRPQPPAATRHHRSQRRRHLQLPDHLQPDLPRVDWHQGRPQDNESATARSSTSAADAAYSRLQLGVLLPRRRSTSPSVLSQNQQFEDALTWFHYPLRSRPGRAPIRRPKRFWIPKPLHNLTTAGDPRSSGSTTCCSWSTRAIRTAVAQVRQLAQGPVQPVPARRPAPGRLHEARR